MNKPRIFGLDLLRCIAICMVVYWHEGRFIVPKLVSQSVYSLPVLDGVAIFFVLSGFLIGGILLRVMAGPFEFEDLRTFWARRWFRTLPNYYLVVAGLLGLYLWNGHRVGWWWLANLGFVQNFAWPARQWLFPDSWSLSVEEWFYFAIPLTLWLLCRVIANRQRVFLGVAVAVFLFSLGSRLLIPDGNHIVICRLDAIMLGCLAAWAHLKFPEVWSGVRIPGLAVGLVLWFMYLLGVGNIQSVPAGTAFMLPWASTLHGGESAAGRFISFIARISYSMYLVNSAIVYYLLEVTAKHTGIPPLAQYALSFPLTIGIAWALHVLWEVPMMNLRDRKTLSPAGANIAVAGAVGRVSNSLSQSEGCCPKQ